MNGENKHGDSRKSEKKMAGLTDTHTTYLHALPHAHTIIITDDYKLRLHSNFWGI